MVVVCDTTLFNMSRTILFINPTYDRLLKPKLSFRAAEQRVGGLTVIWMTTSYYTPWFVFINFSTRSEEQG